MSETPDAVEEIGEMTEGEMASSRPSRRPPQDDASRKAELDAEAHESGHASASEGMVDVILYSPGPTGINRVGSRRRMPAAAALQCYADMVGRLREWEDKAHSARDHPGARREMEQERRDMWARQPISDRKAELENAFGRFRERMDDATAAELEARIEAAIHDSTGDTAMALDGWVGDWWKRTGQKP